MLANTLRPFLALFLLAFATGCANRSENNPASDTLRTPLPAAELPTFAKGDSYTFDNPRETWRVVQVSGGLVSWKSALSGSQVTMFDPVPPPIRWSRPDGGKGERKFLEWSGGLFPLKTGNKLTFKSAVRLAGRTDHARFIWNCYVGHPRQVTIPAGKFAAFPVFCRRNDGLKTHTYYAPALHRPIAITTIRPTGRPVSRQLIEFKEGSGRRVEAPVANTIPAGWSAAAAAKPDTGTWTGSRIGAKTLADANPPVSIASRATVPSRTSAPLSGKAGKSDLAVRNTNQTITEQDTKSEFYAHIGSFGSKERAERGWRLFKREYGDILSNQTHSVARVELGPPKGTTFRLYAGPLESANAGKRLCLRIHRKGGFCQVRTKSKS